MTTKKKLELALKGLEKIAKGKRVIVEVCE